MSQDHHRCHDKDSGLTTLSLRLVFLSCSQYSVDSPIKPCAAYILVIQLAKQETFPLCVPFVPLRFFPLMLIIRKIFEKIHYF